jgi:hypothetical protein
MLYMFSTSDKRNDTKYFILILAIKLQCCSTVGPQLITYHLKIINFHFLNAEVITVGAAKLFFTIKLMIHFHLFPERLILK